MSCIAPACTGPRSTACRREIMSDKIRILMLEDRSEDTELVIRELRKGGLAFDSRRVDTGPDFAAALSQFAPDVILSDYTLPEFDGTDALQLARLRCPQIPFIFVSGTIGEERAIEALKRGAVDYVLKDNRARLVPSIRRALQDVHERNARQEAQQALVQSEERFRCAMQFSAVGMALVDPGRAWLGVNPALCRLLGYTEEELRGVDFAAICHPEERALNDALLQRLLEGQIETFRAESRLLHRNGGTVWTLLSGSLVRGAAGTPLYFIVQIQDITDRVNAEHALRASEERFRSVAEASQDWIWEIDAAGVFTFSSPAVAAILGHGPSELIGRSLVDLCSEDGRPQLQTLLDGDGARTGGWRGLLLPLLHATGSQRWLDSNALPLLDASDVLVGYRGVARDVTERRQHEERIARLSRIQALLSGINATIVRVRDRAELFRDSCRIAVRQGGFMLAWIGQVVAGEERIEPVAWESFDGGLFNTFARRLWDVTGEFGPLVRSIRERTMIIVNDIETDDDFPLKAEALANGYRSQVILPLTGGSEMQGVLVLYAGETGFFDAEETKLLNDLAGDISFALDYIGKEERLAFVSYYDVLTGLANRQLFFDRLAQSLASARINERSLGVMIIDVQRFKGINDTLGRSAGDRLLKEIADRLQHAFSSAATPARIGSDTFAVIIPNLLGPNLARWIDEWVIKSLAEPFMIDGIELRANVKAGIALFPEDADTAEALFNNAEAALKRTKAVSVRYLFYSPEMNARVAERMHLESRLRRAVEVRQFRLFYQPKIDLRTREILGLEALLRWHDPEGDTVPAVDFIPLLEESGLIVEVGLWVIRQAAADLHAWHAGGRVVPRVAVNISQVQLRQSDFVASVRAAAEPALINGAGIDLEITESLLAENNESNLGKLSELRAAGMQIYLDDFGTGYSGLSQIALMPLDALKIDRAFIAGMTVSAEHRAIVSTIVNLAKAIGVFVVAEGVETEEQAELLVALGCTAAQGYLFSPAVPAEQIADFLPLLV